MYKRTGAPTQPTDTRTTAEKQADLYRLRIDVRSKLSEIADGENADKIVQQLEDYELRFLSDQLEQIVNDLKPKYRTGVLAEIFIPYFMKYMDTYQRTQGVAYGLQQESGERILLNQQIIMQNMITPADVTEIGNILSDMSLRNNIQARNIAQNLAALNEVVNYLPEYQRFMQMSENAIMRDQMEQMMNDLIKDLPTKRQIRLEMGLLYNALNIGNLAETNTILEKLDALTQSNIDIRSQIQVLRQLADEASQLGGARVLVPEFTYLDPRTIQSSGKPTKEDLNLYLAFLQQFMPFGKLFTSRREENAAKQTKITIRDFLMKK